MMVLIVHRNIYGRGAVIYKKNVIISRFNLEFEFEWVLCGEFIMHMVLLSTQLIHHS